MIKFIFLAALSTIVFWFVWNFMQRTFGPNNPPVRRPPANPQKPESKIHWDAETVEFEEVKKPEEKK